MIGERLPARRLIYISEQPVHADVQTSAVGRDDVEAGPRRERAHGRIRESVCRVRLQGARICVLTAGGARRDRGGRKQRREHRRDIAASRFEAPLDSSSAQGSGKLHRTRIVHRHATSGYPTFAQCDDSGCRTTKDQWRECAVDAELARRLTEPLPAPLMTKRFVVLCWLIVAATLWARGPLDAQGSRSRVRLNDAHFHLTDYIQQGPTFMIF
jgi:hypothetical protein